MKKLLTKALMLAAILGFTSAATFAKDYADLPKDHWAYKQIQILTDFTDLNKMLQEQNLQLW